MKSKTTKIFFTLLLITASIVLITCKNATEPENNVVLIIPGEGMAGIKLGDSRATVLEKLGNPTGIRGVDGWDNAWRIFCYEEGKIAGLYPYLIEGSPLGPGYLPVDEIKARYPFKGKTKEGIGLGALLKEVHKTYGLPQKTFNNNAGFIAEYYCMNNKKFEIGYEDSIATVISIGYYYPRTTDQYYPCNN